MSTAMFDAREVLIPGGAYDRFNQSAGWDVNFMFIVSSLFENDVINRDQSQSRQLCET